jgi:hypothetical protein
MTERQPVVINFNSAPVLYHGVSTNRVHLPVPLVNLSIELLPEEPARPFGCADLFTNLVLATTYLPNLVLATTYLPNFIAIIRVRSRFPRIPWSTKKLNSSKLISTSSDRNRTKGKSR